MKPGLVLTILFLICAGCGKEHSGIPDVYVDYRFTDADFIARKNANNVMLVPNQGVAGLIICKSFDGRGYIAFDRCSTVNPEKKCAVTPDESSFTATDPCSGAIFSLFDGAPAKAPAKIALKQYTIIASNTQFIVTN